MTVSGIRNRVRIWYLDGERQTTRPRAQSKPMWITQIMSHLITSDQLAKRLASPDIVLFDCRFQLADPEYGRRSHAMNRVPGAHYVHLDHDLSSNVGDGSRGRHPLPDPQEFSDLMARYGVSPSSQVVCYDDVSGPFAARMWWLLHWIGHSNVQVLSGGFTKWVENGHPTQSGSNSEQSSLDNGGTTNTVVQSGLRVGMDQVEAHIESLNLVDSRAKERYLGIEEPIDHVAGHIPGAVNIPWMDNLTSEGVFLSELDLRNRFLAAFSPDSTPVFYCGSGVTACHNILATQIAGFPMPRLFAESWSGWIHDDERGIIKRGTSGESSS